MKSTEKCKRCGEDKSFDEFHFRSQSRPVKRKKICKDCASEYAKEYRRTHGPRARKKVIRRPSNEFAWGEFRCF